MGFKLKKQIKNTDAKWFEFDAETKVQIASIDNPDYQVALARFKREILRNDEKFAMGEVGVVDGEKTEYDGQCRLLANHVVRDWCGVQDEDGNPLQFSRESAEALMLGDVQAFLFVLGSAKTYAVELREELMESVGKQPADTSGSGSGAAKPKKDKPSTTA